MHKLFASQTEYEKVYMVVRQHWIVLLLRLTGVVTIAGLLTFLWVWSERLLGSGVPIVIFTALDYLYFSAVFVLLLGCLLVIIFYYLHLQIITDMRMVDVDQLSLFKRNVSEIIIENVEEPTSMTHGFLATIFDYGNVEVQTSGSEIQFVFERVPHPEAIKKLILDLYEQRSRVINSRKDEARVVLEPLQSHEE